MKPQILGRWMRAISRHRAITGVACVLIAAGLLTALIISQRESEYEAAERAYSRILPGENLVASTRAVGNPPTSFVCGPGIIHTELLSDSDNQTVPHEETFYSCGRYTIVVSSDPWTHVVHGKYLLKTTKQAWP